MGDGLGSLNVKELTQPKSRLERGITRIRSKKEVQLEHENACLIAKVAETERIQQLSMIPGGNDFEAIQAYLSHNLQLDLTEEMPAAPYPTRDKKILHLEYVFLSFLISSVSLRHS
ncbi:agamous-like MADS-box AGL11 [Olea europaea subsp. europaea]|uniref:Agamous-like MADS-box AGL11 n=1 Tax=Olea europaea subsp. europaea TaxID=158383 RepID=A0A8S0UCM3_OLEEU|nr:agamous-like MADS-box AGL11 [Olea europaea subsp. europaea]